MSLSIDNTVPKNWKRDFRNINVSFMLLSTIYLCVLVLGTVCDSTNLRCVGYWKPVSYIVLAAFLVGISLLGLLAVDGKKPYLQSLFLLMLLVVIIVIIISVIFISIVTAKMAGKEYKIGDYSPWVQKRISNWNNIKNKCLLQNGFCFDYNFKVFQSGCCKPPNECNFVNQSPLVWNKPMTTNGNYSNNPDCGVWDNDPKKLCFNCDSCKTGFLEEMNGSLIVLAIMFLLFTPILVFWYVFGVITFKKNCSDTFTLPR